MKFCCIRTSCWPLWSLLVPTRCLRQKRSPVGSINIHTHTLESTLAFAVIVMYIKDTNSVNVENEPITDCWTRRSKVHLNSHEVSGSSWVFSDVGNYPVSRQCLVKDGEMHILHRLHSIEKEASNRPQCLSVSVMKRISPPQPHIETHPTTTTTTTKHHYFWNYSSEFQIKVDIVQSNAGFSAHKQAKHVCCRTPFLSCYHLF